MKCSMSFVNIPFFNLKGASIGRALHQISHPQFSEVYDRQTLVVRVPRGIPQIRRVEDMLAGIPRTTDATNKLEARRDIFPPQGTNVSSGQRRASVLLTSLLSDALHLFVKPIKALPLLTLGSISRALVLPFAPLCPTIRTLVTLHSKV